METKLSREDKIKIASIKMALKFYERTSVTFDDVIKKAEVFESYIKIKL